MADPRPVLLVTNYAPPYRRGAFARLHAREEIEVALVGGGLRHGGPAGEDDGEGDPGFPARTLPERDVHRLAASGNYRAVIAGMSGRLALPSAHRGARRARVPFVLWATLWAHPRTAAHVLSFLPTRMLYRDADAIATYGPHVSAYVRRHGARCPVVEAPQAVDTEFWSAPATAPFRQAPYQAAFVGRLAGEKGVTTLLEAWDCAGLEPSSAALALVGDGRGQPPAFATSAATLLGRQPPRRVRDVYAGADVVVVPSRQTRDFREPWGLVVNEAFHQGRPVIATDSVGAVAGGLVVHERNGLVVPAGDASALSAALLRLRAEPELRQALGEQARLDVAPYTQAAWAQGMARALAHVGVARSETGVQASASALP